VSRQAPEQLVKPVAHDTLHTPPEHTWPAGQMRPQPPQWLLSVPRSRQVLTQTVRPEPHDTAQVPLAQT
jgi:hypothetical protein